MARNSRLLIFEIEQLLDRSIFRSQPLAWGVTSVFFGRFGALGIRETTRRICVLSDLITGFCFSRGEICGMDELIPDRCWSRTAGIVPGADEPIQFGFPSADGHRKHANSQVH